MLLLTDTLFDTLIQMITANELEKSIQTAKILERDLKNILEQAEASRPNKKRTYVESFGPRNYDCERYGQEIYDRFFVISQGHNVVA